MSKARDIANILSASTNIATDAEVATAVSNHATAVNGHAGRGITANRPASPTLGDLYFDTTLNSLIAYRSAGWEKVSQDPAPQIASISPTTAATTGTTITITGSSFKSGLAVQFIGTNAAVYNSPVAVFVGATTATATTPALPTAYEPYDVKVVNADNQFAVLENCLDSGGTPIWNTASGTVATINEQSALNVSVSATDPDGTSIVYSSSNLPSWVSLNSSTGSLTGTAPDISSNTTYSFDITASDGVNALSRSFNVVSNYLVPLLVDYLVVAGGGGGGGELGGGGGAGGMRCTVDATGGSGSIESALLLTTGTPYSLTVGDGGAGGVANVNGGIGGNGINSVFSTITSTGGGAGARGVSSTNGGSGGGSGQGAVAGTGLSNQGFGGGTSPEGPTAYGAGGGGGAGAVGQAGTSTYGGNGGVGRATSISGTSTYYAGGGGGGVYTNAQDNPEGQGGLGGGGKAANTTYLTDAAGFAGQANTGGGGGGAVRGTNSSGSYLNGGAGGSGIVILKYPNQYTATVSGVLTSSTSTAVAGYKITTFTAGTGTVTF